MRIFVVLLRKLGIFLSETEKNKKKVEEGGSSKHARTICLFWSHWRIQNMIFSFKERGEEKRMESKTKMRLDLLMKQKKTQFPAIFLWFMRRVECVCYSGKSTFQTKKVFSFSCLCDSSYLRSRRLLHVSFQNNTRANRKEEGERTRLCREEEKLLRTHFVGENKTKRYGRLADSGILFFSPLLLVHSAK